jgi:hypothetical protein
MAYIRLLCFLKSQQAENINTKTKEEWQELAVDKIDTTKMTNELIAKAVPFSKALTIVADKVEKTRLVKGKCWDMRTVEGDIIMVRDDFFDDGRPTLNEDSCNNGSFFVMRVNCGEEKAESKKYLERKLDDVANHQYKIDVTKIKDFAKIIEIEDWKDFKTNYLIDKSVIIEAEKIG